MAFMDTMAQKTICDGCPMQLRRLCRGILGRSDQSQNSYTPRRRAIPAETRLHEENERLQFSGILRKGYLRTERIIQDGRRSILNFFAPGDLIGEVFETARGPALISATDAEICTFDPAALRRAMQDDTRLFAHFLAEAMKQHQCQLEMVWRRGALTSRERVIAFMIFAVDFMPVDHQPDGSIILTIKVSRKDWADFSNTSVETICRTLAYLTEKDLVETVAPTRYRIRDLNKLAHFAGLDPQGDQAATHTGELPQIVHPSKIHARLAATLNQFQPRRSGTRHFTGTDGPIVSQKPLVNWAE